MLTPYGSVSPKDGPSEIYTTQPPSGRILLAEAVYLLATSPCSELAQKVLRSYKYSLLTRIHRQLRRRRGCPTHKEEKMRYTCRKCPLYYDFIPTLQKKRWMARV